MNALLDFLQGHMKDRGLMADLRCALIENKRHRAWLILAPFGGIGEDWQARTVQTVAGLFATHPLVINDGDFGDTCRRLLSDDERQTLNEAAQVGPLSRRFQHLLAANDEEIFDRIMRLALRAKSAELPINYNRLYGDLLEWRYRPQNVRTRWAKSFWAPRVEEPE